MSYSVGELSKVATVRLGRFLSRVKSRGFIRTLEFKGFRDYQLGDDFRNIDWAASAKAGKLLIKEYSRCGEAALLIMLDCSGSMSCSEGLVKDAVESCATLALMASTLGDPVGLAMFNESIASLVIPSRSRSSYWKVLRCLTGYKPSGGTSLKRSLKEACHIVKAGSRIFVITDLHVDVDDLATSLELASSFNHKVFLVGLPVDDPLGSLKKAGLTKLHYGGATYKLSDKVYEGIVKAKVDDLRKEAFRVASSKGAYVVATDDILFGMLSSYLAHRLKP